MKKSNKDPAPIFDNNIAKNFVNELFDTLRDRSAAQHFYKVAEKNKSDQSSI